MSLINIPVVCSIQGIVSPYAYRAEGDALKDINSKISRTGHGLKSLLFEKGLKHQYRLLQLMATRETQYFSEYRNFIGRTEWDRRISSVMAPGSKYFLGDEIMRDAFYKSQWIPVDRSEKWIIHTTASDHPMKGFRTIVDAVRLLKRIDIEMEWRVAGLSESSSVVRVLKKELGGKYPGESIRLLGRINSDELVARMLEAHVFVLPSYMENSPNSLCEAMMLGMPCIATNSGGIPSILQDRDEGILIQTRDPWVMAGALLEIFDDPSGAIQKGIAARRRALLRHDPIRIADQTLHVYNSILGI
jgi:glycosyltransferase involved in cell wall biosynthesis